MTGLTKRLTIALAILVLAVGAGVAGFAAAQDRGDGRGPDRFMQRGPGGFGRMMGRGGPGGPFGDMMLGRLDLTDAQREQIRTIVEARRAATDPLTERARTAREALQDAIETQPVDAATIRARSAELAAVEADLAVARAELHAEIVGVLTSEQQTELAQIREERDQRMAERRERFRGQAR
jgi:protein CpxP